MSSVLTTAMMFSAGSGKDRVALSESLCLKPNCRRTLMSRMLNFRPEGGAPWMAFLTGSAYFCCG